VLVHRVGNVAHRGRLLSPTPLLSPSTTKPPEMLASVVTSKTAKVTG
jgi:hypothetical protein